MARIFKRKNSKGVTLPKFYLQYKDQEERKTKVVCLNTANKREAESRAAEIVAKHERIKLGLEVPKEQDSSDSSSSATKGVVWTNFWQAYYLEYASAQLRPITIKQRKQLVERFQKWVSDNIGPSFMPFDLNLAHFVLYRNYLVSQGHKPNTINRIIADLSSIYSYCADKFKTPNPIKQLTKIKTPKYKRKLITLELFQKFLESITFQDHRDILIFQFYTACRISEVINFKPSWVHNGEFYIPHEIGKGAKERSIPIHATVREIIERRTVDSDTPIFGQDINGVVRFMQRASKKSGIKITSHDIRTLAMQEMRRSGMDIETVRAIVGHSDYETLRYYWSSNDQDKKRAIDSLELDPEKKD